MIDEKIIRERELNEEDVEWIMDIFFDDLSGNDLRELMKYCKEILPLEEKEREEIAKKYLKKIGLVHEKMKRLGIENLETLVNEGALVPTKMSKEQSESVRKIYNTTTFYLFKAIILEKDDGEIVSYMKKIKKQIVKVKFWKEVKEKVYRENERRSGKIKRLDG